MMLRYCKSTLTLFNWSRLYYFKNNNILVCGQPLLRVSSFGQCHPYQVSSFGAKTLIRFLLLRPRIGPLFLPTLAPPPPSNVSFRNIFDNFDCRCKKLLISNARFKYKYVTLFSPTWEQIWLNEIRDYQIKGRTWTAFENNINRFRSNKKV